MEETVRRLPHRVLVCADTRVYVCPDKDTTTLADSHGSYHLYKLDIASSSQYKEAVIGLRFNLVTIGHEGSYTGIHAISWKE